jgi:hypothetical protein
LNLNYLCIKVDVLKQRSKFYSARDNIEREKGRGGERERERQRETERRAEREREGEREREKAMMGCPGSV